MFLNPNELISNAVEGLGASLGLTDRRPTAADAPSPPWLQNGGQPTSDLAGRNEVFFRPFYIDPTKWNRLYPYRLLVVDMSTGNPVVVSSPSGKAANIITPGRDGIENLFVSEPITGRWEIALPISPQNLQITDQFAINTSATMRGVVEEHNGVKFKNIAISGTTGIWPIRPTKSADIKTPTVVESVFGGAIGAFNDLQTQVDNFKQIATGQHPARPEEHNAPQGNEIFSTGYYQALYLGQFLEAYATLKKNPAYASYRLVFDMPKRGDAYIVTPVMYRSKQNQQSPSEYLFDIQLKGWKRINLQSGEPAANNLPGLTDPGTYQTILNSIDSARRVLGAARNVVGAVRSDVNGVLNNLREVAYVVKDLSEVGLAIAELPNNVIADARDAIKDTIATLEQADQNRADSTIGDNLFNFTNQVYLAANGVKPVRKTIAAQQSAAEGKTFNEMQAVGTKASAGGKNPTQNIKSISSTSDTDPINKVFEDPNFSYELFRDLEASAVTFNAEQTRRINDETDRLRLYTIQDLRVIKTDFVQLSNELAAYYGAGDDTYAQTYGLQTSRDRTIPFTPEEDEIIQACFDAVEALDLLTATQEFDQQKNLNPNDFVAERAEESGIEYLNAPSKVQRPVPFGLTLEEIAARYLGDPDKWIEIATINKLRSPYIDEEGYTYDLLTNGSGRQLTVNDIDDRLYVGQVIELSSSTINTFKRRIIDLEEISDGVSLVTVNGDADLDVLTTANDAKIKGFLPGTVNSSVQIFIPVETPSDIDEAQTFTIPDFNDNALSRLSKTDFLLDDNYDLAINGLGDFRLATGMNNLIQALKLKIITKKGSILRHLEYGLGLQPGISIADIESGSLVESLSTMIQEDPRFASLDKIAFRLNGPTLAVDMSVSLADNNGVLPITFDLRVA